MSLQRYTRFFVRASVALGIVCALTVVAPASAVNQIPTPAPQAGSYGLEATKKQPPPTKGATISTPGNGASYTSSPITVSGVCPDGLLVQIYDNGVMVGSVECKGGSFTLQVSLFSGKNDLTAGVFDDLDQTGPESNLVSVTYTNAVFSSFGSIMTLSSSYGRRAAQPNATLVWPLLLSGGTGPYAFSIDWGDGSAAQLKSQASAGDVKIEHVYKKAGLYHVTVKVTDVNGVTAFLQLVAIANGQVATTDSSGAPTKTVVTVNKIMWVPMAIGFGLLFPTYWLGRRSELVSLHKRLQKSVENYKEL